jgi:hypothetical protein
LIYYFIIKLKSFVSVIELLWQISNCILVFKLSVKDCFISNNRLVSASIAKGIVYRYSISNVYLSIIYINIVLAIRLELRINICLVNL